MDTTTTADSNLAPSATGTPAASQRKVSEEPATPIPVALVPTVAEPMAAVPATRTMWDSMRWLGGKALEGIEYIGETVASIIGLDDSRFQYVIDGMDENDWETARKVDSERKKEEQTEEEAKQAVLAEEGVSSVHIERNPPNFAIDKPPSEAAAAKKEAALAADAGKAVTAVEDDMAQVNLEVEAIPAGQLS